MDLLRRHSVEIKGKSDIEAMRRVCQLAAETLVRTGRIIKAGISTLEIDRFVHEDTLALGARPAPLNYKGFPKSVCTSVNEVVCHGIPSAKQVLKDGDIINVDVTHIFAGFHGDTSATFYVGEPSPKAQLVVETSRHCLELGIREVRAGARLGDIGAAIQEFAEARGCSVVTEFVGHGIGREFHAEPKVSHTGVRGRGLRLKAGMTFTIEPMINLGRPGVEIMGDGWTALTADRSLSAQFEHTVLVTDEGCEVLTERREPLENSERYPHYWDTL